MNSVDVLKYGHLTVLQTLDDLPQSEWRTPGVCGWWSVQQIVAHLASFEHLLVEILQGFLDGGPTPYLDQYFGEGPEQFNDAQVAARQEATPAAVLAEYKATQEQAALLAAQVPAEVYRRSGTLAWYGAEYDLEDFIVYSFYGHKREHCAQINVFKDRLKGENGR